MRHRLYTMSAALTCVLLLVGCGLSGEQGTSAVPMLVLNRSYSTEGITVTVNALAMDVDDTTIPLDAEDRVFTHRFIRMDATIVNTTSHPLLIQPRLHTTLGDGGIAGTLDTAPLVIDTLSSSKPGFDALQTVGAHQTSTHNYYFGFDRRIAEMALYPLTQAQGATRDQALPDLFILTLPVSSATTGDS